MKNEIFDEKQVNCEEFAVQQCMWYVILSLCDHLFLAVYDVLYICIDNTIYYYDDSSSAVTIIAQLVQIKYGLESDVSGYNL